MKKKYKLLDHTADLAIQVNGKDLNDLFRNSSIAIMDLSYPIYTVKNKIEHTISATGNDAEQLLVNWLQEILYLMEVKKLVFCDIGLEITNRTQAKGTLFGEKINYKIHEPLNDIKAVTFSNLKIVRKGNNYSTEIVLDI